MRPCPNCGSENADDARFCSSCGTALTSAEAAREERKVVTVLFADLVGFTSRAEQMDPEDVRALVLAVLRPCARRSSSATAGRSRSSSATRSWRSSAHRSRTRTTPSARCALRLRSATGSASRAATCTCGLRSRPARRSCRSDARPGEGEGMASGDVVNTAARLQSAAPVDGVLVDETTYRATESGDRVPGGRARGGEGEGGARARRGRRSKRDRGSASTRLGAACAPHRPRP